MVKDFLFSIAKKIMELAPGQEAPALPVIQPTAPVVVFDSTKKAKRPMSDKQKAQLAAARLKRIENRKLIEAAIANGGSETAELASAMGSGVRPVAGSVSAPVASKRPADDGGDLGGAVRDGGDSVRLSATGPGDVIPVTPDQQQVRKRHKRKDYSPQRYLTVSSTFNEEGVVVRPVDDPVLYGIRMGKRRPLLWADEKELENLVQAKIPKNK